MCISLRIIAFRFSTSLSYDLFAFWPFLLLSLLLWFGKKLSFIISGSIDCKIMPRLIFVGLRRFQIFERVLPPFYPLVPLFVREIPNFLNRHDSDFLDVVVYFIEVQGLFLNLQSFLVVYGLEEVFELFRTLVRVDDCVCVFIDEVHLSVGTVEDQFLFGYFLHF
jgi:hypothetical protein